MNILHIIKQFCNEAIFWYFLSIILGIIFLDNFIIKNEWQKQRIENKVCDINNLSFQYRIIWYIKHKLLIYMVIFFGVFLINILIINESDFNPTLSIFQKIRNLLPSILIYLSLIVVQKVSIEESSNEMLDKFIILFLKIKNMEIEILVKNEIVYLKKQNNKMIHRLTERYIKEKAGNKQENVFCNQACYKLLYILLEYSAYDEFELKHKHEIRAFQSDSMKVDYLARVISLRASLKGEKPFNEKEFCFLCSNILPEIGINYSDIFTTIKRISKYSHEIVKCQVIEKDTYFQDKFINNSEAKEEITKDLFDEAIDNVFTKEDIGGGEKYVQ